MIIMQMLVLGDNPAFDASMIVALKTANVFDKIKNEIANPAFNIGDYDDRVNNAPSDFCKNYQVSDKFIESAVNTIVPTYPNTIGNVTRVLYGKAEIAKIVGPLV